MLARRRRLLNRRRASNLSLMLLLRLLLSFLQLMATTTRQLTPRTTFTNRTTCKLLQTLDNRYLAPLRLQLPLRLPPRQLRFHPRLVQWPVQKVRKRPPGTRAIAQPTSPSNPADPTDSASSSPSGTPPAALPPLASRPSRGTAWKVARNAAQQRPRLQLIVLLPLRQAAHAVVHGLLPREIRHSALENDDSFPSSVFTACVYTAFDDVWL